VAHTCKSTVCVVIFLVCVECVVRAGSCCPLTLQHAGRLMAETAPGGESAREIPAEGGGAGLPLQGKSIAEESSDELQELRRENDRLKSELDAMRNSELSSTRVGVPGERSPGALVVERRDSLDTGKAKDEMLALSAERDGLRRANARLQSHNAEIQRLNEQLVAEGRSARAENERLALAGEALQRSAVGAAEESVRERVEAAQVVLEVERAVALAEQVMGALALSHTLSPYEAGVALPLALSLEEAAGFEFSEGKRGEASRAHGGIAGVGGEGGVTGGTRELEAGDATRAMARSGGASPLLPSDPGLHDAMPSGMAPAIGRASELLLPRERDAREVCPSVALQVPQKGRKRALLVAEELR